MTEQCSRVTRSPPGVRRGASCTPSDEQRASAEAERQQAAEGEAEARRNAYFASGGDEGGRCASASSDASTYAGQTADDPKLKASQRTKKLDPPLQPDVAGNMIVSAVAGGLLSGARSAAAEALLPSAGGRSVLEHAATATATNLVKSAGKTVAKDAARSALDRWTAKPSDARPAAPSATTAPTSTQPAGRSGPRATSEPAREPTRSEPPPGTETRAPVCVPGPVVIQG